MLAFVFPELLDLLGMAGQAWIGHIVAEGYLERCVWVLVATEATFQFIVGFPCVALAALGDVLLGRGPMGRVAVEAGDRIVACACGRYFRGWRCMALGAIIERQARFCRRRSERYSRKAK